MSFRTAAEAQAYINMVRSDAFPSPPARRHPTPPNPPPIRVCALTANWLMAGRPVTVGEVYSVSANEAHRLVFVNKAEFV